MRTAGMTKKSLLRAHLQAHEHTRQSKGGNAVGSACAPFRLLQARRRHGLQAAHAMRAAPRPRTDISPAA